MRHTALLLTLAAVLVPAPAFGAHAPHPFEVTAAITACKGDSLTVSTQIAPASGEENEAAVERGTRAVRGARLHVRFEAAPLYGPARRAREIDLGRTTSARRSVGFEGLPAQTYEGVVRYRWVRGGRTVVGGVVRTRTARTAGRRGRAFCSLRVGKKPVDTRPPLIFPLPSDSAWKRGPLNVYLFAVDDLSGVALVAWQLDRNPIARGRNVRIASEGTHQLAYVARDAAGNQTAPARVTLRVDMNPPTAPVITSPAGSTTDTTPEIRWDPSTDSASGVQRYLALVRDANRAIVWSRVVRADAPLTATVDQPLALGQYTAEVIAVDGATPQPFTSIGSSSFSIVGAATATTTDSDADGVADATDNCAFAANTDQADQDTDGAGDVCDSDDDNDGVADTTDNCATTSNQNQADADKDGQGDVCDSDDDNDTVADTGDNCPATANQNQANFDGDSQGDACDSDDDNDGLTDAQEATKGTNPTDADSDDDTVPDATDQCPTDSGPGPLGRDANGCPRV